MRSRGFVAASAAATGRRKAQAIGERRGLAVVLDRRDTRAIAGWGRAAGGPYHLKFSTPK